MAYLSSFRVRIHLPGLSPVVSVLICRVVGYFQYLLFILFCCVSQSGLRSSHSHPPCFLQLSEQTNPLPLDTPLRCGDLLCLSGRILSDTVAPVNKRKAPEARGVVLFVRREDYPPHTPFCLFPLSAVISAYSMPMPA